MQINGFQKLTLLDFPGKVACIVFTAGCNFRCPFCHNATLVTHIEDSVVIDEDEVFAYLQKRKGLIDGVVITGGEPLLQPDLAAFIRRVRALGLAVKLDTNGSFPERLRALLDEGLLDYVAMDVKNSRDKYARTAGVTVSPVDSVAQSVALLRHSGVAHEFRTTVVSGLHTRNDVRDIAAQIGAGETLYLQNFVDSGDLIGKNTRGCSEEEMKEFLEVVKKHIPNAKLRGIS